MNFYLLLLASIASFLAIVESSDISSDTDELKYLLKQMNEELALMNRVSAKLEWESLTKPTREILSLNRKFLLVRNKWKKDFCSNLRRYYRDNYSVEMRMIYLFCRGPIYTTEEAKILTSVLEKLATNYAIRKVCRPEEGEERCYHGEPDLKIFMSETRNESELRWAWTSWRNEMSRTKKLFEASIVVQNFGAQNNGYHDIGEYWREELEIPDLEKFVNNLYEKTQYLYRLLHAVVRYRLREKYPGIVELDQPIPAHLLGDLWSQNWEKLIDLILPKEKNFLNITKFMKKNNYTVYKMVKHAEDYFESLGFPKLPNKFWSRSLFTAGNSGGNCHASAANMFEKNDFRIVACLRVNANDFSVIHHEIGHIYYYMAYENQSAIFQNGVNSAFHEAIGDSVMLGVMTSQHLQRLGLAEDTILTDDLSILLRQALAKLPELPYAFLTDKWRWRVFSNEINSSSYNFHWWKMHRHYMGIEPPDPRNDDYFDPAAKFHIVSNVPYIRYFIANILQYQLFDGMCEAAVTGRVGNPRFSMELHRCDIYGLKNAVKNIRSLMSRGSGVGWREWIQETTGMNEISPRSLLRYYEPVKKWLESQIERHRIPVGWE